MSATEYRVDRRDQRFVLFEQLRVQDLTAERYADYDQEVYEMILDSAAKMAEEVVAPVNGPGDRQGCTWVDREVTTPEGFAAAYKAYVDAGWIGLGAPLESGGQGVPHAVNLATIESFTGAGCAFMMYPGLSTAAANLLRTMGAPWMQEHVLPKLMSGEWAGTMSLTEPQAGSAVGDVRTIATRDGDAYRLQGTKIFVSGGEQDLTDNIMHIMLARTADAPPGIKGLSLFLVSKYEIDPATGALGDRNDLYCSGIEHKMGINGSATCTLSIGDGAGAQAFIIGEEGQGITRMFHMMNEARIAVGVQGYSVAAAALGNAVAYAKDRVQGTSFSDFKNAEARRVPIIEHPDVSRMLLHMRSLVHGMRALGLSLSHNMELFEQTGDESYKHLVDVLVPICKAWNTDQAFEVCRLAVQVFGGYGFIGEYPVEQHVRDSKIFSIYEGTNGIQALDLVGRKMGMKGGQAFMGVLNHLNNRIAALAEAPQFAAEAEALGKGRDRLGACAMHFMQKNMAGDADLPVLHACDMLALMGDVVVATLLADQALIAAPKLAALANGELDGEGRAEFLAANDEARFYAAKLDNLRYFAHQVLPRTAGLKAAILSEDRSALQAVF